jgi:hypothetical protein
MERSQPMAPRKKVVKTNALGENALLIYSKSIYYVLFIPAIVSLCSMVGTSVHGRRQGQGTRTTPFWEKSLKLTKKIWDF